MSDRPDFEAPLGEGAEGDAAWRDIVANYGARPSLEVAPASEALDDEPHFEPPEPPPAGLPHGPRGAAWLGVLGSPLLFLLSLLSGVPLAGWLGLIAMGSFVAGLAYLVASMRRDDDDPWNDGAVV